MSTETLVRMAQAYSAHTGLKLSTISTYATNDGKFFGSQLMGAGCTLRRADTIMKWFSDHWPADLEWPHDIPRPKPTNREAA